MRLALAIVSCLFVVGCASGPSVSVMRMGPVYPALPESCPLVFLNNQHFEIAASGYEHIGLLSFHGSPAEMDSAASAIPGVVGRAACKMGGTSVSLNVAMGSVGASIVQFSVWRAPGGVEKQPEPAKAAKPAGDGI